MKRLRLAHAADATLLVALAFAPAAQAETRGELLYTTHCIACHTAQLHWRDRRQATDWNSLQAQVRRWQATAMLGWPEEDVVEVTRYLNRSIYHFREPSQPQALRGGPAALPRY